MNLLIVDDNVPMVRGLKKSVVGKNFLSAMYMKLFRSHRQRKILEEETIDLLLCDIEMPSGSGWICWNGSMNRKSVVFLLF